MAHVSVTIAGRAYRMACDEGQEEHLLELGRQLDTKIDQLRSATGKAADKLFFTEMTEHHVGGIHMAQYAAQHASDAKVRDLANRIVTAQQSEIAEFKQVLAKLG